MARKIKVMKKHIDDGDPGSFDSCPIALALIEAYEEAGYDDVHVSVGEHNISVDLARDEDKTTPKGVSISRHENVQFDFDLPKKAQKFIDDFDDNNKVKPFDLTVPF
jgi:hypothetical protein